MSFLNKFPLIALSPMDGVTDEPFRLLQTQIAKPDLIFTEFVSAEGISHGGVKLYDTLLYSKEECPIIGQLFGKDSQSFYKSAIILSELGFDGIDINMGCPAKTVTQNGSGAALIGKPELAVEIIKKTKQGIEDWFSGKTKITDLGLNQKTLDIITRNKKYSKIESRPVKGDAQRAEGFKPTISVKTRLGIDKSIIESWAPILLAQNLDFLTIHGRTLKQGYSGRADWSEIKKVVELAKNTNTKIFGNGDIENKIQALEFCQKYGVDGILIGRSACGNPWCFSENNHIATPKERFSAMLLHAQLFTTIFPHRRFDSLRKNFLFYASGLTNAKQLRNKLVRLNSVSELLQLEGDFLS